MPQICDNIGSAARDFAMLERNLLSHIRLATVLLLLGSSVLLNARLPSPSEPSGGSSSDPQGRISVASLQVLGALAALGAGVWEYRRGYKDMQDMKGFLEATRPHFYVMSAVAVVVFATTIVLIADRGL